MFVLSSVHNAEIRRREVVETELSLTQGALQMAKEDLALAEQSLSQVTAERDRYLKLGRAQAGEFDRALQIEEGFTKCAEDEREAIQNLFTSVGERLKLTADKAELEAEMARTDQEFAEDTAVDFAGRMSDIDVLSSILPQDLVEKAFATEEVDTAPESMTLVQDDRIDKDFNCGDPDCPACAPEID